MRLIRDGGKGVWRWGEREIIYLSLYCHHQNDFCIKMGSDESHFNVSAGSDGLFNSLFLLLLYYSLLLLSVSLTVLYSLSHYREIIKKNEAE